MKINSYKFSAILLALALLGGCASTATKNKLSTLDASSLAYGKVVKMFEADTSVNRSQCDQRKDDTAWMKVCSILKDYDVASSAIYHSGRFFTYGVFVPKSEQVQEGNFIAFSPARKAEAFKRVVARQETETCKWIGPSTDMLNGRSGMAVGFLAGLLIVPTIVVLANDEVLEAGVVCEGWTYKTLLNDAIGGT